MSRHRNVRNLDYDEEYVVACDNDVLGHSVDDSDYGVSPGTEQYLYSRSRDNTHGFGLYFPTGEDIKEEEETFNHHTQQSPLDRSRHDSSSYEKPSLSPEEEVLLASVLDELRNVLGDQYSEGELTHTAVSHNFELESSLNALLNKASSSSSTSSATASQGPQPQRERRIRQRDNAAAPAEAVKQLSLAQQNSRAHAAHPPTTITNAQRPPKVSPAAPVIVTTPMQGAAGASRVVRGFDVLDTEEVSGGGGGGGAENSLSSVEQESKRSRSNTPVRGGAKDKDMPTTPATPMVKPPPKIRDRAVDVASEYREQRGGGKTLLNLVVVGHVDAGKSTLMGHLLYLKGNVAQRTMHKYEQESKKVGKQSFMYAWVLDDTDEERSRGITVDVAQRMFETDTKVITLLDAPGHRDFIPNMITGAARADVAVLVVDASKGAFEAGFESGGQTREHALLVRSLGVSQLVVAVNKLDAVEWSEDRMKEVRHSLRQFLKTVGYKDSDVNYIPCSGLTGQNLTASPSEPELTSWYTGPTLLAAVDQMKVPERGVEKPVRMCICDVYKGQGSNMCVAGRLDTGYLQTNDRLLLLPQGDVVTVKNIQVDREASTTVTSSAAFAGDHLTLTLSGADPSVLHMGDFLCDPAHPIPLVTRCQARIVVFNIAVPLIKGAQLDFHYQAVTEPAKIRKLVSLLHKTTGQTLKTRPRALVKNSAALVELEFTRPLCLELFRDYKDLGRFMLRTSGTTLAAGLVTQILA